MTSKVRSSTLAVLPIALLLMLTAPHVDPESLEINSGDFEESLVIKMRQ